MVRNTRSLVDVKLPKRLAVTLLVGPSPLEREICEGVSALVRGRGEGGTSRAPRLLVSTLLREAGSSPFALRETLGGDRSPEARSLLERLDSLEETEKTRRLVRLLAEKPGEREAKELAIRTFRDERPVLPAAKTSCRACRPAGCGTCPRGAAGEVPVSGT